jgi:hypothetical protein
VKTLPAWAAFAQRLGGRLERGSMAVRGATLGAQEVEIETLWSGESVKGTSVRVVLSPPLDRPLDVESPEVSAEVRDLAAAIGAESRAVKLGPAALSALVAGPLDDPAVVEPLLEKLDRLARAVRGLRQAGPFR